MNQPSSPINKKRTTTTKPTGNVLSTGNDWAGQRRSEKVSVLENGIALDGPVAQLLNKLALQVLDDELDGAHGERFLLGGSEVFNLADVGLIKGLRLAYRADENGGGGRSYHEGDDVVSLLNEPFQDDTCTRREMSQGSWGEKL